MRITIVDKDASEKTNAEKFMLDLGGPLCFYTCARARCPCRIPSVKKCSKIMKPVGTSIYPEYEFVARGRARCLSRAPDS